MTEREEAYLLREKIQMDDACLGGERPGGKDGLGSENKIPIVAAVSLNEAGHPNHARIAAVSSSAQKRYLTGPNATSRQAAMAFPMAWPASAP